MEDETEVIAPEAVEEELEEVIEEEADESVDELKAKLAKAEEIANNQRIRAEKAEKAKKEAPTEQKSDQTGYSLADQMALLNAKVDEEDIERVERFAKSEGISIKEALKNSELKAILAVRSEERTTANVANVSNVRRGNSRPSDESLLQSASAGKLPESDDDIERLMNAKLQNKG